MVAGTSLALPQRRGLCTASGARTRPDHADRPTQARVARPGEFMRSRRWQGWIGLFLCALVSVQGVSRADEGGRLQKHYDSALTYYNKGAIWMPFASFRWPMPSSNSRNYCLILDSCIASREMPKRRWAITRLYLRVEPNPEPKLKAELRPLYPADALDAGCRRAGAGRVTGGAATLRARARAGSTQRGRSAGGPMRPATRRLPALGSGATAHAPESGSAPGPGPARRPAQRPAQRRVRRLAPPWPAEQRSRLPLCDDSHPAPPGSIRGARPALLSPAPPPASPPTPLYKRGWFWGVLLTAAALTAGGSRRGDAGAASS